MFLKLTTKVWGPAVTLEVRVFLTDLTSKCADVTCVTNAVL